MAKINDFRIPSEFIPNGYDVADISKVFDHAIIIVYRDSLRSDRPDFDDVYRKVVSHFNDYYSQVLGKSSCDSIYLDAKEGGKKLEHLIVFDKLLLNENEKKAQYIKALFNSYYKVINNFVETQRLYEPKLAEDYLNSYFNLSKNIVFYPESINLTSTTFRKSNFLRTLLSFAAKEISCNIKNACENEAGDKINDYSIAFSCYELSFFDPFAYDIISRALMCASRLIVDSWEERSEDLFVLRKNMFICSIESAFQRVFTLDGQSYRVELNRHTSKLIAYPIEKLSSVSDTKSIRLFEKTAAYIRNRIDQDKKIDTTNIAKYIIKVTILGHSELSVGELESSMTDYLSELLHWYDSLGISPKPQLELRVNNHLNRSGKPDILDGKAFYLPEKRKKIEILFQKHFAICKFVQDDYELKYTYSLKEIKNLIDESDLLFILDCPWLSTENYSIEKERSINDYCLRLERLERNKLPADTDYLLDFSRYYRESPMAELNDQYNRIMSSTSLNAGSVVRSMRDDMIRQIQKYMDDLRINTNINAKELYIFSSENEGVNYSYINSYPLTRLEQYDGKHFTIIQFTTRKLLMLPCITEKNEQLRFEIDIWSVLKYLCFSFAFKYPLDILQKNNNSLLKNFEDSSWINTPIELLELIQNTVVVFELSNSLRKIQISLGFTYLFDDLVKKHSLSKANCNSEKEEKELIDTIKEHVGGQVLKLIKPLYRDTVFSKSKYYGDDAIKLGFKMTLYSAASNVNTMLFYHLYEEACKKDDFSCFEVSFDTVKFKQVQPRDFKDSSFFADKKLYCTLFNSFESDYQLYLGMVKMLLEAQEIYSNNDILIHVPEEILLDNMELACNRSGLDNTIMFTNLLRAKYYLLPQKERQKQNEKN